MLKNRRRTPAAVVDATSTAGATEESRPEPAPTTSRSWQPPAWFRMLPELVMLAICGVLYSRTGAWDTTVEGPGPAFYPQLLIGLLAIAMLVRIGQHVLAMRRERSGAHGSLEPVLEEGVEFDESAISMVRVWQAIALAVGYAVATLYMGWVIATFVFVVVFLYMAGKRNLLLTVPLGGVLAVGLAYVFVKVVYIALPTGIGVFDLVTIRLLQAIGAF